MTARLPETDHAFVVLAYGQSPFLHACLEGLKAQSAASRLIVATSTPNSSISSAAGEHGAELAVNPKHEGIAADWNFGLQATTAAYVTLAHQDDAYQPHFARSSLAALRETGAALCFTGYGEIDDEGRPTSSKISRVQHAIEWAALGSSVHPSQRRMRAFLALGNPLPCSSVTFDRRRLADFVFSDRYESNLDWDAWLRLVDAGVGFARVPDRLVGRRRNRLTATSRLVASGRRQAEDIEIFRRLWPRPLADMIAFAYRAGYQG